MKNSLLLFLGLIFSGMVSSVFCVTPTEEIKTNLQSYGLYYGRVNHVNSEDIFNQAISTGVSVFVKIGASWCGPCRQLEPILKTLSTDFPDILFIEVDFDHAKPLARKYGVKSLPTVLLFNNGSLVTKSVGFKAKDFWVGQISAYF